VGNCIHTLAQRQGGHLDAQSDEERLIQLHLTFMCFLGLFELGSLICTVDVSSHVLIVGRAVVGMSGACLVLLQ